MFVIELRIATPSDVESVADGYLAARKQFLPYAPLAHPDDDVRRWIREILIPAGGVTVAVDDHQILGMMALSAHGGVGWVDQLYLRPDSVGRGIGSMLIEHAKASLGPPIRLYTFQENHLARRFYERHGFQPIAFTDGAGNEERCPDVLYEWTS
jgi:ribosomal protein S18 acetylase RimI-like enzyme